MDDYLSKLKELVNMIDGLVSSILFLKEIKTITLPITSLLTTYSITIKTITN